MKKKGQTIFIGVVVGIFIFMFGMLFVGFIDTEVENAIQSNNSLFPGGAPGLDCGPTSNPNANISDGAKLTCLATEAVVPYFIVLVLSIAGGAMAARFLG